MINVSEAQETIKQHLPHRKKELVPIKEAYGCTISKDVYAEFDIPGFSQSSMDGYAIRFEEKTMPLHIQGEIPAGSPKLEKLSLGSAFRIFTGAPLPEGADTVVMQEKTTISVTGELIIEDSLLTKGLNVRPVGSEVKKGVIAVRSGTYISAAAIGYLAGMGCDKVEIYTAPKVSIILIGNELIKPGKTPQFGQVFEANSFQLESVLRQCGIKEISTCLVPDSAENLQNAFNREIESSDIVFFVGGISVGDYDFVLDTTQKCGVTKQFHKVAQKPGKPFYFGTKGDKLVFGLPGNPASALTCFYVYIASVLTELQDIPSIVKYTTMKVTSGYSKKSGLTHFLKAHYNDGFVTPLHAQESYRLQSYAQANCLMILDKEGVGCKEGDLLEIIQIN